MNRARFSIFAEVEGHNKPLFMTDLSFARIIDDVVLPFETEAPFFIDGVPVTKKNIKKIKIIRETLELKKSLETLHKVLRTGFRDIQKDIAEQYDIRVEAILRESGEDVTSQVIKAFDTTIRPKLKDYLPRREELIQAALVVFTEAIKVLGSHSS